MMATQPSQADPEATQEAAQTGQGANTTILNFVYRRKGHLAARNAQPGSVQVETRVFELEKDFTHLLDVAGCPPDVNLRAVTRHLPDFNRYVWTILKDTSVSMWHMYFTSTQAVGLFRTLGSKIVLSYNDHAAELEFWDAGTDLLYSAVLETIAKPVRAPRQQRQTIKPDIESVYRPLSDVYLDHKPKTSRPSTKKIDKVKEKTRGQPSMTPTITETEEAIPDEDDIEVEKVPVNERTLGVFRTLFFDPSTRTTLGEIS
ncbi:unnamed protein product [Clonostachys rhizophaga]|uniref:Uncharacterized protein n=1 Tax=Clonostachys rhizophaga TaxID=160324 RepID=A0A9N9VUK4_9HYPO|nr:unnamed protein product [Clonostachys rhizophaga]